MRSESASWVARGVGLTVGVGLVLILASVAVAAREVMLLVFLAVLLGAALEPVVGTIRGRTGLGRGLSILIVYATFLVGVIAISVFIVPPSSARRRSPKASVRCSTRSRRHSSPVRHPIRTAS